MKTKVQYFEGLMQFLRASGAVVRGVRTKGIGKDPRRVLQAAVEMNSRDSAGYDEIWIVVDVDDHTTLEETLVTGKRRDIPVVVSNPCFEIWLVWHYEDCNAYQEVKHIVERLVKYEHTEKQIPNSFPYHAYKDAALRAGWLKRSNFR